jgi:hypothetical protein
VCALPDGRVAVVEPESQSQISNAVVFEEDGEEAFRVIPPALIGSNAFFGDVYYVANELTFFCLYPGRDIAIVVDEADGMVLREYETR